MRITVDRSLPVAGAFLLASTCLAGCEVNLNTEGLSVGRLTPTESTCEHRSIVTVIVNRACCCCGASASAPRSVRMHVIR